MRAIRDVETEHKRNEITRLLGAVPKGLFLELIGGSSKVYIDWRKRHGFPWNDNDEDVDVIQVLKWFRSQYAERGPKTSDEDAKARADAIKLRNLELDLEERELKHAERKQEVLKLEEFNEILLSVLGGIGRVADRLTDEHKRMLADEMREAREAYASRFNGHSDTRITDLSGPRGARSSDSDRDAADAADAPRVRSQVRDHAARRPKGGPKVS